MRTMALGARLLTEGYPVRTGPLTDTMATPASGGSICASAARRMTSDVFSPCSCACATMRSKSSLGNETDTTARLGRDGSRTSSSVSSQLSGSCSSWSSFSSTGVIPSFLVMGANQLRNVCMATRSLVAKRQVHAWVLLEWRCTDLDDPARPARDSPVEPCLLYTS